LYSSTLKMFRTTTNFRKKLAYGDTTDFGNDSICPIDAVKLFRLSRGIIEKLGESVRTNAVLFEKASLSDLYVKSDYEVTFQSISRFQRVADKFGYRYKWKNEFVTVTWNDEDTVICKHKVNDYDCQRKCDLSVILDARERIVSSDFLQFMSNWPYAGHEHLLHYGVDGVRLKDSPQTLPYYAWEFVRTGKERDYKKLSPSMADELAHLFRVSFKGEDFNSIVLEEDALKYLRSERIRRLDMRDRGAFSKTYMSVVPGKANNFNKFYAPFVTGTVHHFGSGTVDKLSRYSFPNSDKVICIDPVANGPGDLRLFHVDYDYDTVREGDWIVSDADKYDVLVEHFGKPYCTGLNVYGTNEINNFIYAKSLEKKCPVILKLGIQPENDIPYPLNEGRFVVHSKIRLHNAEVVVRSDPNGFLLCELFKRFAYVCRKANELRVRMDTEHIYPTMEYRTDLLDLRPTVLELADEVMINVEWDEPGVISIPKDTEKNKLPGSVLDKLLCEFKGFGTFKLADGELAGRDFVGAYRYLVNRKKISFKDSGEIINVLCEYARNTGISSTVKLGDIYFG